MLEQKEESLKELQELQEKYDREQELNRQKELEELGKINQLEKSKIQEIKLNNAIMLIQKEFQAWKEAGGGKKKSRKGKKGKK